MKKLLSLTLAAAMSLTLCSCRNESESQKEENKRVLEQAEENAAAYIRDKYGFDADITDSEIIYEVKGWDFMIPHSEATSSALITLKHDGREFQLIISGKDKNTDGADNYQAEEIKDKFCGTIRSELGEECNIYYANKKITLGGKETGNDFCCPYFDGSDFSGVISNLDYCIIELYGTDLSDAEKFDKIQQLADCTDSYNFYVVSYDSKWSYDKHPVVSYLEKCEELTGHRHTFDISSYSEIESYRHFHNDGTSEYHVKYSG